MLGRTVLSWLCHEELGQERGEKPDPLFMLRREFPDLLEFLRDKTVLDFGCGHGDQAGALAALGINIVGLDTNVSTIERAKVRHPGVEFLTSLGDRKFDVIISQDAMEHFPDPAGALEAMKRALNPGGRILMTFGPLWFSPYGAHMHFFCPVPWLHLIFRESTVMAVRAKYRSDGARRYEEVESGLNKMSLAKFERLIARAGLTMERRRYHGIKGLPLDRIPIVRELGTNLVSVILCP